MNCLMFSLFGLVLFANTNSRKMWCLGDNRTAVRPDRGAGGAAGLGGAGGREAARGEEKADGGGQ